MKCYACGKLGHISRDCQAPNGGPLSTAGKTCYRCGEAGKSSTSPGTGYVSKRNLPSIGHISRDCPQAIEQADQPPVANPVAAA